MGVDASLTGKVWELRRKKDIHVLSLKNELRSLPALKMKHFWKLEDELLFSDDAGHVLAASPTNVFLDSSLCQPATLNQTKKIRYRPHSEYYREVDHVDVDLTDDIITFHRGYHADMKPILSVNPLWLVVTKFQTLLRQHISLDGLHADLELEPESGLFIPKAKRYPDPHNPGKRIRYRAYVGSKRFNGLLEWDEQRHGWSLSD